MCREWQTQFTPEPKYKIGIFVYPVCMITVLCVSPYIYCNLEMNNIMW